MEKGLTVTKAIIIAALAACALLGASSCFDDRIDGGRPLFDVLHEAGYQGSDDAWADFLTDEQAAALDIAYEHDVASGYQGTKDKWIADRIAAHYDNSGEIVVVMPDGGEFTIAVNDLTQGSADGGALGGRSESEDGNGSEESSAGKTSDGGTGDSSWPGEESVASDAVRGAESDGNASELSQLDELPSESSTSDTSNSDDSSADAPKTDASGAIISVDSVQTHPGDTNIAVAVRIEHNPGVLGATLSVSYDPTALTLKSAENGEAFKDVLSLTRSRTYETGCLFAWDGVDLTPADVKDGTILTLYFDVAPDAAPGIYPIVIREAGSTLDANLGEIGVSVQDGSVVVG